MRRGAMEKELARCIAPAHSFDGRIAAASADADLVIANLGAWYNNVPSKDAKDGSGAMSGEALAARYEDDLGHLLRRLRAHERRVEEGSAAAARALDGVCRAARRERRHRAVGCGAQVQAVPPPVRAARRRAGARLAECGAPPRRRARGLRRAVAGGAARVAPPPAARPPPQHEGVRSGLHPLLLQPPCCGRRCSTACTGGSSTARGDGAGLPSYLV